MGDLLTETYGQTLQKYKLYGNTTAFDVAFYIEKWARANPKTTKSGCDPPKFPI